MTTEQVLNRLTQRWSTVNLKICAWEAHAVGNNTNTDVLVALHEERLFLLELIEDIKSDSYTAIAEETTA